MALTVLNNIASLTAENALSNTQMNLQKTLTQLSTGLKINSGSDDPAGLSIANGLQANIAALTQSQQNASNGIGMLQTADGALSQVTTLLNRATTLATEASTSNVTSTQATALNTEFASILSEVNQIGNSTNFNGQNVFSSNTPTSFTSTQASLATSTQLTSGSVTTITDSATGGTFVFKAGASSTVQDLQNAVTAAVSAGTLSAGTTATLTGAGALKIGPNTGTTGISVSSNDSVLGPMEAAAGTSNTNTVYIGDGTTTGAANTTITTTINSLSATSLGLNSDNLSSTAAAQTALADVTAAINTVAAQRGTIGASVNRLTAASSVMSSQVQNLTSAENSVQNADVGKTVANMTQYNILQSTGMAALQQSNQAQQAVLKLVQ
ncbi:flagellin [Bryocella elongata]|uniref:Flagellin n=1 Tax=Bryocella elongata TaxID=863522 RepID=A0A1H5TKU0_9BACT|nr:flagellin [Bryocella elongata]SEF63386.1 flagellin [Bryocella elongata]